MVQMSTKYIIGPLNQLIAKIIESLQKIHNNLMHNQNLLLKLRRNEYQELNVKIKLLRK